MTRVEESIVSAMISYRRSFPWLL